MTHRLNFIVIAACAGVSLFPGQAAAGFGGFARQPLEISDWHLFDMGTADIDDDGDLDLYTTNHLERQSILANDGSGLFEERLYSTGLGQTPSFPGWEDDEGPEITGPGLYISHRGGLRLRLVGNREVSGSVEFMFPTYVEAQGRAMARVRRDEHRDPDRYTARFTMHGNSELRLKPEFSAHPYVVRIKRPFSLADVFVGARSISPSRRRFVLYRRDRHGMAWGDFNSDRQTDVFVVRGGLQGRIRLITGAIQDELLLQDEAKFANRISSSGIRKGACRGRSAGAVDLNGDDRLDVFSTCQTRPPKLYRRRRDGTFKNASHLLRGGAVDLWVLKWIDLDGDGVQEIIGVDAKRFAVFRRRAGGWARTQVLPGRHNVVKDTGLSVADFNNDGDPDVYAPAASGSTLLVNHDGRLRPRHPADFGLPGRAVTGTWVDYANDGLLDLHTIPGGLFRQRADHRFGRTGLLSGGDPYEARLAWPDLDANGARDAVSSFRQRRSSRDFDSYIDFNQGSENHWLEVDLIGSRGNRMAIGGRVQARSGGVRQTQWVGQNESSSYSQGHYRLYFGLGAATAAHLKVTWPDGAVQKFGSVAVDQLVQLKRHGD